MELYDLLRLVPLLTAVTWMLAAMLQVVRLRIRTWTERFFVAGLIFFSLYALNDWLFFNIASATDSPLDRAFLVRLAMSYLTLVALFFLLFEKAFHSRTRRMDLLFLVPTFAMLTLSWTLLVRGVQPAPWGWKADFDPLYFLVWLTYGLGYMIMGVRYIYRISVAMREENPRTARKTQRMSLAFIALIVMGASTNSLFALLGLDLPPLFSSLLLLPGIALLFLLSPLTKDQIATFMIRWKAHAYEVRHAFLVYENGTLIASVSRSDETAVDKDIFAATLDAIQSYMRTSFPLLRGKWLKTIEHGAVKILLERGRNVYLAVVLSGAENDLIRRIMKDIVTRIETQNPLTLPEWSGVPEAITGARSAMERLFKDEQSV